jgi:hypothetical protein
MDRHLDTSESDCASSLSVACGRYPKAAGAKHLGTLDTDIRAAYQTADAARASTGFLALLRCPTG